MVFNIAFMSRYETYSAAPFRLFADFFLCIDNFLHIFAHNKRIIIIFANKKEKKWQKNAN